tara:strand:+ start:1712 stop:2563 length:852 start_codon:yes stop_codon:yes gene_type:complete
MKYLIEFTVLFSIVIIYYLHLATNVQDNTLGNLVYIPLIIMSVKYPMVAFVGLICVILYNQQTIEGYTGNSSVVNEASPEELQNKVNQLQSSQGNTTSSATTNSATTNLATTTTSQTTTTPISENKLANTILQNQKDQEKVLVKNLVTKIKQLRATGRTDAAKSVINQCIVDYPDVPLKDALMQCGVTGSNGELLYPFAEQPKNVVNSENYQIASNNLPITGTNAGNVITQTTTSFPQSRVGISDEMRTGLSDRSNQQYSSASTTSTEPSGTNTSQEGFTSLY